MTAPDKIWACIGEMGWYAACCSDEPFMDGTDTEYTRTDLAQAAVAAAYEAAAQVAASHAKYTRVAIAEAAAKAIVANLVSVTQTKTANAIEDAILLLATPDQIAALAAERAATVTVKPLVWIKHPSADIWRCDTMIGTYKVFGGMPSWDFDSATDAKDKTSHTSTSAKLAKAASQADYDARIRSAITITSGDVLAEIGGA